MYLKYQIIVIIFLFFSSMAQAENYHIERQQDGPFSFSISGTKINDGSTLSRESIIFNDPTCPVSIKSHSTKTLYINHLAFYGNTEIDVKKPVVAIQVRTLMYDIFGQYMKNLVNTKPKDFSPGKATIYGEWRATGDASEMLTTVTYVARARLADGTQWVFNSANLHHALKRLDLEPIIGDHEKMIIQQIMSQDTLPAIPR